MEYLLATIMIPLCHRALQGWLDLVIQDSRQILFLSKPLPNNFALILTMTI